MNDDGFGALLIIMAVVGYIFWVSDFSTNTPNNFSACRFDAYQRFSGEVDKFTQSIVWCMDNAGYEPDLESKPCSQEKENIFVKKECYQSTAWYAKLWRKLGVKL